MPKTKSRRATLELIPDALSMLIRNQQSRRSHKRTMPVTLAVPTMQRNKKYMTQNPSMTDLRESIDNTKIQQLDTIQTKPQRQHSRQRSSTVPRRRLPRKMIHIQIQTEQMSERQLQELSGEENESPSILKISSPRYSDIMKPKF